MVCEVEIKSLLSRNKYYELKSLLPSKFTKVNEDSITTVKFKPGDIRVRYSEKIAELVLKDDDSTLNSRRESTLDLKNIDKCRKTIAFLQGQGLEQHPSWITHKQEFVCDYNGCNYNLSLQHTENFAYILEAEIILEKEDNGKHVSNIRSLLKELGCDPINPDEFKSKIQEYINTKST